MGGLFRDGGARRCRGAVARLGYAIRKARRAACSAGTCGAAPEAEGRRCSSMGDATRSTATLAGLAARLHQVQRTTFVTMARITALNGRRDRMRLQFLRAPSDTYRRVVRAAVEDNAEAGSLVSSDRLQVRLFFQRRVPISECLQLIEIFELLQSIHDALLNHDQDLVLGRIAAAYQYLELTALECPSDLAWACTHLPTIAPGDFVAPRDDSAVSVPCLADPRVCDVARRYTAALATLSATSAKGALLAAHEVEMS